MVKKLFIAGAVALLATACDYNDKNFEGLDEIVKASHLVVKSEELVLSDDDYETISKYDPAEGDDPVALANVAKTHAFGAGVSAVKYFPRLLASKYAVADQSSAIKVVYNQALNASETMTQLNSAVSYKLSDEDYASIAEGASFVTSATVGKVADVLAAKFPEAVAGNYAVVTYTLADVVEKSDGASDEPGVEPEPEPTFPSILSVISNEANEEVTVKGTVAAIYARGYLITDGTGYILVYLNAMPEQTVGDVVTVSGTPTVYNGLKQFPKEAVVEKVGKDASFALPSAVVKSGAELEALSAVEFVQFTGNLTIDKYYNIAVDGATKVPSVSYPVDGLVSADLNGQDVTVCGFFIGSSNKNINFMATSVTAASANKSLVVVSSETVYALYKFDGKAWKTSNDASVLSAADYTAMGQKYANLSASAAPETYLPKFLAVSKPYAIEGANATIAYFFYDSSSKVTSVKASEFVLSDGAWTATATSEPVSAQFVKNSSGWIFDPSVVVNLPSDKSAFAVDFYQAATDWVWANVDQKNGVSAKGGGFVTSYGNNEYYTGSSAYYTNVDWRAAKAKEQNATAFDGMSDNEIVAFMQNNLIEVYAKVLGERYPDANLVEGVDVFYTIRFVVYDGGNKNYEVVYKVVDKGVFEYVENSLRSL